MEHCAKIDQLEMYLIGKYLYSLDIKQCYSFTYSIFEHKNNK